MIELPVQPEILALLASFVFLGGVVKGTLGIGLPLVAVPLMAIFLPVPQAIALMAVPLIASNVYQVAQGAPLFPLLARFWTLFVAIALGGFLGVQWLTTVNADALNIVLGAAVILVAGTYLVDLAVRIPARFERPAGGVLGFGAGVLGGVSSFIGPPLVIYLVAIDLKKEEFITTVAAGFVAGMIPLQGTLLASGYLNGYGALLSVGAMGPVLAGMHLGRALRDRIPQRLFRNVILAVLLVIGANLIRRGMGF